MSHRETTKLRPRLGGAAVAMLLVAGLIEIVAPPMASATSDFAFTRIAGSDRYATAASAATGAFASGADNAIVANGTKEHFPDALAASYLAGSLAGPILLTTTDSLPSATDSALQSLKTKKVTIVGGTAAVSSSVQNELTKDGYTVTRIAGANRYDTAAAIAAAPNTAVGTDPDNKVTAVVASGANFPDALVSGPIGYASAFPVEITDPSKLSAQTKQSLQDLKITHVLITGGTSAVSTSTEDEIKALGITTTRFAGTNRSDTAAKVAAYATTTLKYSETTINLARGDDPADSLGSAPYGGVKKTPLLLSTDSSTLGSATGDYLGAHAGTLKSGIIFGGTTAVSKAVEDEATSRARGNNQVTVVASPSSVKADGASTSTITVTVKKADGTAIANDPLTFSTTGTPAAACGTVPASATTNASGQATVTYTASSTPGSCEVTVTETQGSATGKVKITQTPVNSVTITATPQQVTADGKSNSTIAVTVKDPNNQPVNGDSVSFTLTPSKAGSCGQVVPPSATTDSSGKASVTYVSSSTAGFCTVRATESGTGASNSVQIDQRQPASSTNVVDVAANPTTVNANGTDTSTITAHVTSSSGQAVSGDSVLFSTSGTCGKLSSPFANTNAQGNASVTYTASTSSGDCTINGTEADSGASDPTPATVHQTGTITVAANRTTLSANGTDTSTVTATVPPGTHVGFSAGSPSAPGSCGSVSPTSATAGSDGKASTTYTASSAPGTCTVTATNLDTGGSATVTINQVVPYFKSASASNGMQSFDVTYDEPISCATVNTNASDYLVEVNNQDLTTLSVTLTAACKTGLPGDVTVTITMHGTIANPNPAFATGQVIKVTARKGDDTDTVKNAPGTSAQREGDQIQTTVT